MKGKKVKLPRGKVIEIRRKLLDTRGEKEGITLRRKIAELRKKGNKKRKGKKK